MNSVKYAITWNGKEWICPDELWDFLNIIDSDGLLKKWIRKYHLMIEFVKDEGQFKLKDIYSKGRAYSDNNKKIIAKDIGLEVI